MNLGSHTIEGIDKWNLDSCVCNMAGWRKIRALYYIITELNVYVSLHHQQQSRNGRNQSRYHSSPHHNLQEKVPDGFNMLIALDDAHYLNDGDMVKVYWQKKLTVSELHNKMWILRSVPQKGIGVPLLRDVPLSQQLHAQALRVEPAGKTINPHSQLHWSKQQRAKANGDKRRGASYLIVLSRSPTR